MGHHHDGSHGRVHHKRQGANGPQFFSGASDPGATTAVDVDTVVSQVYVTVSKDFSGPVAGYTTLTAPPSTHTHGPTHSVNFYTGPGNAPSSASDHGFAVTHSSEPTAAASSQDFGNSGSPSATNQLSNAQATHDASSSSGPSSSGMSAGASAGLAIGIIGAFAIVAALFFVCWKRRKNNKGAEELHDEKRRSSFISGGRDMNPGRMSAHSADAASIRSSRRSSAAPRLSLRPVTQFLPNLSEMNSHAEQGRPAQNPFADPSAMSEKARPVSPPSNPFAEPQGAVIAAAAHQKSNSAGSNGSQNRGPMMQQTPNQSTTSLVSSAPSGTPSAAPRGPNNVHRVQLDFKPSMEDELELSSGQLVRMLHEYDDGWALCVRMDRSQQGVCPRTCLSKLPVKPRPGPPPGSAGGPPRPGSARSQQRPQTPNGGPGPMAPPPPMGQGPMYPRPLTPTSRGPSPTNSNHSDSQVQGMPNRKAVPGQAL